MNELGKKLRERRGELGLKQKDIAKLAKTDPSTVSNWESIDGGLERPSAATVAQIAKVYQVSEDWVREAMGEEVSRETTTPPASEPQTMVRVRRYYRAAAGTPIDSERGGDEEEVPKGYVAGNPKTYGVVPARGDSMDAEDICDGDLVLYRGTDSYSGGDMAVVQLVDPETKQATGEHTIKRRKRVGYVDYLFPASHSDEHRVMPYPSEQVWTMGVVVARRDASGEWHPVRHRPAWEFPIPAKEDKGCED